jgi:hypothetical protein
MVASLLGAARCLTFYVVKIPRILNGGAVEMKER